MPMTTAPARLPSLNLAASTTDRDPEHTFATGPFMVESHAGTFIGTMARYFDDPPTLTLADWGREGYTRIFALKQARPTRTPTSLTFVTESGPITIRPITERDATRNPRTPNTPVPASELADLIPLLGLTLPD